MSDTFFSSLNLPRQADPKLPLVAGKGQTLQCLSHGLPPSLPHTPLQLPSAAFGASVFTVGMCR